MVSDAMHPVRHIILQTAICYIQSQHLCTYIHSLLMNDALHIDKNNYKQEQIMKIKIELRIKKKYIKQYFVLIYLSYISF